MCAVRESGSELFGFIGLRIIHPVGSFRASFLERVMNVVVVILFCSVPLHRLLICVTCIGGFDLTGYGNQRCSNLVAAAAAAAIQNVLSCCNVDNPEAINVLTVLSMLQFARRLPGTPKELII